MNKPDRNNYPATNPHDLEWGGVDPQYFVDLKKWESLQPKPESIPPSSNSKTDMVERFKKPTDEQIIQFALVFNEGKIEPEKLADMVGLCEMVVDRLYENGDVLIPSSKENK